MNPYLAFKFLHIAGILLWIGPPLGAYWLLLKTEALRTGSFEIEITIRRAFGFILGVEHVGLFLLIFGAAGMLHATEWGLLELDWVRWKIAIFLGIIIPIEIFDIGLGQIVPMRLMRSLGIREGAESELKRVYANYDRFTLYCIAPLLISWAAFFYLAIFK